MGLLELILDSAGEGVYGLDCGGLTTFVNPAACRLLGYSAEELIGEPMHAVLHHSRPDGSDYPREECPIYAAFKDGEVHRVEDEVFWRRDGTCFPVEYTSTPILEDERIAGAVVVFWDITARKQAEDRAMKALEQVERLKNKLEEENVYLQEEIKSELDFDKIIGETPVMKGLLREIETVAPTNANVLVTGETGTGKELIARAIHGRSTRRDKPLIKVNCASIPRDLFESEFFGHVKGAFTGALRDRAGRFGLADHGTLFLDEVGEIPLEMQGKLLRVLQEGQYERIGEEKTSQVDVRVIAATNRNLAHEVEQGRFRRDLFYRLNVFPVDSPPLRQRTDDIPLLAAHIIERAATRLRLPVRQLTPRNVQELVGYDWPGNVRELQNIIERAMIRSETDRLDFGLAQGAAPPGLAEGSPAAGPDVGEGSIISEEEMRRRDRDNIVAALRRTDWQVYGRDGAAALLGMKPSTLASRLKKLGLEKPS